LAFFFSPYIWYSVQVINLSLFMTAGIFGLVQLDKLSFSDAPKSEENEALPSDDLVDN
jgi:hypothetical protein